ncbi:MAG: hypothetical protein ABIJ08_01360 [Nanoarchaeota archaeon]
MAKSKEGQDRTKIQRRLKNYDAIIQKVSGGNIVDMDVLRQTESGLDAIIENQSIPSDLRDRASEMKTEYGGYKAQKNRTDRATARRPAPAPKPISRPVETKSEMGGGGYSGKGANQTTYNVGDVVKVTLEKARSGNDLTSGLPGRKRIFVRYGSGVQTGYTGDVKITRQINDNVYEGVPVVEKADLAGFVVEKKRGKEPAAKPVYEKPAEDLDGRVEVPTGSGAEVHVDKPTTGYTLSIGGIGARQDEKAVVYVPEDALDMQADRGIEYVIRNGQTTSKQGESVLRDMKAHLDSGRPLMQIDGDVVDPNLTLKEYMDMYSSDALAVGVGIKAKEAAAVEVLDPTDPGPKGGSSKPPYQRGSGSSRKHSDVGVGSRRAGAALEMTVMAQAPIYMPK